MALNTPRAIQQVGNTTAELQAKTGVARQIVIDTTKNTVVVMDGTKGGGHPLAKETLKIKSGSPNLKINGGAEATLGGDITLTMLPGYVPTGFAFAENPAGQPAGKYLEIKYTDAAGEAKSYFVDAAILVDTYTAGAGIKISGDNVVSVDPSAVSSGAFAAPNGGLKVVGDKLAVDAGDGVKVDATSGKVMVDVGDAVKIDGTSKKVTLDLGTGLKIEGGKLTLDLAAVIDTTSLITLKDGKISNKSIISADADNIMAAGSDGGVFMPGDLGSLA